VGGNPGPDAFSLHSVWSAPEVTNGFTTREALKVNTTITGPDAAAAMAAAMASSAVIFHQYGTDAEKTFAQTLLQRARKLFAYANQYPFNAQSLLKNPANTWEWWPQGVTPGGGVRRINYRSQQSNDELLFAAGMLYKAEEVLGTAGNKTQYLTWAQNLVSTDQDSKPGPAEFTSNADFFKNTRDIFISPGGRALYLRDGTGNLLVPYVLFPGRLRAVPGRVRRQHLRHAVRRDRAALPGHGGGLRKHVRLPGGGCIPVAAGLPQAHAGAFGRPFGAVGGLPAGRAVPPGGLPLVSAERPDCTTYLTCEFP
jgi:hypothetical protein